MIGRATRYFWGMLIVSMFLLPYGAYSNYLENKGQWDSKVLFRADFPGIKVSVDKDGIYYDVYSLNKQGDKVNRTGNVLKMKFKINSHEISKFTASEETYNYFYGQNKDKWIIGAKKYNSITLKNTFENIDLHLLNSNDAPRFDFIVNPGANPNNIALSIEGANGLKTENNKIFIPVKDKKIEIGNILAYQFIDGKLKNIECKPLVDGNVLTFRLGEYNKNEKLVIDPTIYATYLGGEAEDEVKSVKLDAAGDLVVAGWTTSPDFMYSAGVYDTTYYSAKDVFVSKFKIIDNDRKLVFSTFLGGISDDVANCMAIDQENNIYVAGYTDSKDFPAKDAYNTSYVGMKDGFLAKLAPDGKTLVYASYIGGKKDDIIYAMDVTPDGLAYVTGGTFSSDYPVLSGDLMKYQGLEDLILTKFSKSGTALVFSTYFGEPGSYDRGTAISVFESANAVYVGNKTNGAYTNFWGSMTVFDRSANGNYDAQIVKFRTSGGEREYYSFYGGSENEEITAMMALQDGTCYFAGTTTSTKSTTTPSQNSGQFPIVTGAYKITHSGGIDGFLGKVSKDGKILTYSTYIGGSADDIITSLSKNPVSGNLVLAGHTKSSSYPIVGGSGTSSYIGGYDAFITEISLNCSEVDFSALYGSESDDICNSLAVDKYGSYVIGGSTKSTKFPKSNGIQTTFGGVIDGYILKTTNNELSINAPTDKDRFCAGSDVTIEWNANNYPSGDKFNIYYSSDNGVNWTLAVKDVTSNPYKWKTSADMPAGTYMLRVSHQNSQFADSKIFRIKSSPILNSFTHTPENLNLCPGEKVEFTVDASGEDLTYTWKRNGSILSNEKNNKFIINSLQSSDAGAYECLIKNGCSPEKTTQKFTVTVKQATQITSEPKAQKVIQGATATFSVTAKGEGLTYKWFKNNELMIGETNSSLSIKNANKVDEKEYFCIVSGLCGADTSAKVLLTVDVNSISDKPLNSEKFNLSVQNNTIILYSELECTTNLRLVDNNGALIGVIYSGEIILGKNYYNYDSSNLASGTYWIVAECNEYAAVLKLNIVK